MSDSYPDPTGPRASILDDAIDRAVRRMVQVDPRADLRGRVVARLGIARARRRFMPLWQYAAVASAIAILLFVVSGRRTSAPPEQRARQNVRLEAQQVPSAAPRPAESHPPAPQSAAIERAGPSRPARERRAPSVEVIPMPDIQNVFGRAANTVSGASVSGNEDVVHSGVAETFPESERIAVAELTVPPLGAEQDSAASQAAQAVRPQPGSSLPDTRRRNVSIEIAIIDQTGTAEPVRKVVTLIVAERQTGSVRTSGSAVVPRGDAVNPLQAREALNVDATPTIHQDGSILLSLTLEYVPRQADGESGAGRTQLNERIAVTLDSGKSTVVSRSPDPGSTRRVSVEVTATVLK
jgi:hypothetical protein